MTVTEKLAALRQNMEARRLEGCIVVTDDFHGSEYVGAHFKVREFLSGFTGSAGTLAVLREGAYLWTDGRYFLQAERQLEGSGIQLMRAGQPGVPTLSQFLAEQLPESGALGFDGRTVSTRLHRTLEKALADKHIRLDGGFDPAAGVWTDRPGLSAAPVWAFDSGVTRREKLTALRQDMAAQKAEWLLLTDLTDVAWALELRGGDVACTPVFLGFLLVGTDSAALYAQAESFAPEIRAALAADSVALRPYGDIYGALRALPEDARVLADSATANSRIAECLAHTAWTDTPSPAARRKAVKAGSEQTGFRQAHLQDGAALCRFLYEMKSRPEAYTELSAAALLLRDHRRLWPPRCRGPLRPHTGDGRAAEGAGTAAGGQRRTLRPGHDGRDPHHSAGPHHGRGTPEVHTGAAGPHTAGHGTIPPGGHGGKPGRTGPGPAVAGGPGL